MDGLLRSLPLLAATFVRKSLVPRAKGIICRRDGKRITTLCEWPREPEHWKSGRSAMENARLWTDAAPYLPIEIENVIQSCANIGEIVSWCAKPEAKVNFDNLGRAAQPDVLLTVEDKVGHAVVAIEAKVNEPFGDTLGRELQKKRVLLNKKPNSNGVKRIYGLANEFGLSLSDPSVKELRYQLLTHTAAVVKEAERKLAKCAMVVIHEFASEYTIEDDGKRNARDLDNFMHYVLGYEERLDYGQIAGPLYVNNSPHIYFVKTRTFCQAG